MQQKNNGAAAASQVDSDDEFQDAIDDTAQMSAALANSNDIKPPNAMDVIQIHSESFVQNKNGGDPDAYIMKGVTQAPNSFVLATLKNDDKSPAPKYFSDQVILQPLPTLKEEYLYGFELQNSGNLVCTDQEALEKQKGILANVAKQLALNLLKGLSISHISLPIKIFEERSSIQRIVDLWSSAPRYLSAAAMQTDPEDRIKHVVAFALSNYVLVTSQNKPFNPLLGETNQGMFEDGTRYYCEHTCHHPPITHFLVEGPDNLYRMHGYYEFIGSMGNNTLTSGLRGPTTIEFQDGGVIRFNQLDFRLGGTIVGDRTIELIGSQIVEDITNKLRAVMVMSTYKSTGFFSSSHTGNKSDMTGIIYKVKGKSLTPTQFGKKQKLPEDVSKIKDIEKKVSDMGGNWLTHLNIGQTQYWHIDEHQVTRQIPQTEQNTPGVLILPSDWRFREDLIWLKYGFMQIAAEWKLKLEVQQRFNRKLRQDAEKTRGKK